MHQETDQELRAEADRLLASGLRELLADYGEVHVVGSHALNLMVWRDLDIHLVQERLDRKRFFELGGRIAGLLRPHRMHYRDETIAATPELPKGLYWGVYLGDERDGAWKIDIWLSEAEAFEVTRAYGERIKARLSEAIRPIILQIKVGLLPNSGIGRKYVLPSPMICRRQNYANCCRLLKIIEK